MNFRELFFADDDRLRVIWRMLIFICLILLAVSPLILFHNSTLQFFGATTVLIVGLYLNARYLDKRPFSMYGLLFTKRALGYLVVGMVFGGLTVSSMLALGHFTGMLSISKLPTHPDLALLLLFGLKMVFVAIIEESLYRGYFFTNLYGALQSNMYSNRMALISAVGVSSLLFGLAHFSNDNASVISIAFLTINGMVWCIPFIMTKSLGLSIGLHASWNFFQTFYGFTMSGNKSVNSIFDIKNVGDKIWTGGDYGPEAGLFGLLGFMTMLLLILVYLRIAAKRIDS